MSNNSKQLDGFEIILGVTGGIAAYKSAHLCSQLVQQGAGVTVIMTQSALKFVGELTFSTLTGRKVITQWLDTPDIYNAQHITLTDAADLFVIAPATANIIAKCATGISDDALSTFACSLGSDILLAPAMNSRMYDNPATQRNITTLKKDGYHIIGPDSGQLACGDVGPGRMSEPEIIFNRISELLSGKTPKRHS